MPETQRNTFNEIIKKEAATDTAKIEGGSENERSMINAVMRGLSENIPSPNQIVLEDPEYIKARKKFIAQTEGPARAFFEPAVAIMRELGFRYVRRNPSPNAPFPVSYNSISGYEDDCLKTVQYEDKMQPDRVVAVLEFQALGADNDRLSLYFDPAHTPEQQINERLAFLVSALHHLAKTDRDPQHNQEKLKSLARKVAYTIEAYDAGHLTYIRDLLKAPMTGRVTPEPVENSTEDRRYNLD